MKKIIVVLVVVLFSVIFSQLTSAQKGSGSVGVDVGQLTSNVPSLIQTGLGDDGMPWAALRADGGEVRAPEGTIAPLGEWLVYIHRVHHLSDTDQSLNTAEIVFVESAVTLEDGSAVMDMYGYSISDDLVSFVIVSPDGVFIEVLGMWVGSRFVDFSPNLLQGDEMITMIGDYGEETWYVRSMSTNPLRLELVNGEYHRLSVTTQQQVSPRYEAHLALQETESRFLEFIQRIEINQSWVSMNASWMDYFTSQIGYMLGSMNADFWNVAVFADDEATFQSVVWRCQLIDMFIENVSRWLPPPYVAF